MKKLLLISTISASFFANAQTTLFEDNFESHIDFITTGIGQYTLFDNDDSPTYIGGITPAVGQLPWANAYTAMVCQVFNPSLAGVTNGFDEENSNFDPHGGNKYLAFWAATTTANDDWLVLPKVTLGLDNKFSFWVKSLANDYGLEKYKVAIYDGTAGAPATSAVFQTIGSASRTAPLNWTLVTVDIPVTFNNKPVYLAINYISSDIYMMMVDDLKITTETNLATHEAIGKKQTSIYPNPSKGLFNLKSTKKISSIEVFSADGKKLRNEKNKQTVDLSSQPNGVYVLKSNFEDGSSDTNQLIKK